MSERVDRINRFGEKVLEAERLSKRNAKPKPKRKWQKVYCPKCTYRIDYEPKPNWDGRIHCPHCGHNFKIALLTDSWTRKDVKEMTGTEVVEVKPSQVAKMSEVVPGIETEKETTKKEEKKAVPHPVWKPLVKGKTTITLDQIESALLKIPNMFEITDKNPKENCFPYAVGPRKSVFWIYPKKAQAKIVIGQVDKDGKISKISGIVDEKGVLVIADEKIKITQLVKLIKTYIRDRKWDKEAEK